jgi:hypothetical protein
VGGEESKVKAPLYLFLLHHPGHGKKVVRVNEKINKRESSQENRRQVGMVWGRRCCHHSQLLRSQFCKERTREINYLKKLYG